MNARGGETTRGKDERREGKTIREMMSERGRKEEKANMRENRKE